MKKTTYSKIVILLSLCYFFQGCKDEINQPDQDESQYNQLYMPQAVKGAVVRTLIEKAEDQTLIYGANVGGRKSPDGDIKVSFHVDQDMAAAYNSTNHTSYEIPPAESFQLSGTEAVIKKGTFATEPLKLAIKTTGAGMKLFKTYLIPITITSDHMTNANLKTTFFLVRCEPDIANYPDYDRSGWKVIDFSTQESSGEGPNNGRAIFAFDNDINTFWHSQWTGSGSRLPHYLTVDMGTTTTVHGCNFIQRQASGIAGKADSVVISYSLDNNEWIKAAGIHLQPVQSQQKIWLPDFVEARYLKFTIVTTHSEQFSNMAEIGAY